jgi:murein DD-endopeptidase MepM/ murein hydrolase activator NlpD
MRASKLALPMLAALALTVSRATAAPAVGNSFALTTLPGQVFFSTSNSKEKLSGSIFFLVVQSTHAGEITPQALTLTYRANGQVVRTDRIEAPLLAPIALTALPPLAGSPPVFRPLALRLQLNLPDPPLADLVEAQLSFSENGQDMLAATTISVKRYEQRTTLAFPFVGNGMISSAGALQSGHRNRSGLYAIDALGLTANYGPMIQPAPDDDPANHAGWGRQIIAPAAGTIVVARNDHVDQPVAGNSDPAYFLPQYKNGGDPGNLVVIDHGNGEFSMIAHMQKGSVRVKVGDRVTQGQVLGLLGNSGDTSGPHVHYQLQNGPDWEKSDALPYRFTNVQQLTPGAYFSAKPLPPSK